MSNLNDLIPCTQSSTWTEQATAFSRALELLPKRMLPSHANPRPTAHFHAWLVGYMNENETEALGNYPDLILMAADERSFRRR